MQLAPPDVLARLQSNTAARREKVFPGSEATNILRTAARRKPKPAEKPVAVLQPDVTFNTFADTVGGHWASCCCYETHGMESQVFEQ